MFKSKSKSQSVNGQSFIKKSEQFQSASNLVEQTPLKPLLPGKSLPGGTCAYLYLKRLESEAREELPERSSVSSCSLV